METIRSWNCWDKKVLDELCFGNYCRFLDSIQLKAESLRFGLGSTERGSLFLIWVRLYKGAKHEVVKAQRVHRHVLIHACVCDYVHQADCRCSHPKRFPLALRFGLSRNWQFSTAKVDVHQQTGSCTRSDASCLFVCLPDGGKVKFYCSWWRLDPLSRWLLAVDLCQSKNLLGNHMPVEADTSLLQKNKKRAPAAVTHLSHINPNGT